MTLQPSRWAGSETLTAAEPPSTGQDEFQEGSSAAGFKNVPLETFYTIAERVMARRNIPLTDIDRDIYKAIYNIRDRYK